MKKLEIIVISYNTKQMTLNCLQSVYEQTRQTDFCLTVLDNNSSDGSADAIEESFPGLNLIRSDVNYGFALGNNIVAEKADAEYILLLNPDTVVLDGAIDKLMAFAEQNQDAKIWGGNTVFEDGSLNTLSCHHRMTLWNQFCRAAGLATIFKNSEFFNQEHFGGWQHDTVRRVDIVSGCFFLIRLEFWKQLGGFDERFFMYGEEADLCLRAHNYGADPIVTPTAVIVHFGGASSAVKADRMVKLLAGKTELIKVHWSDWQKPFGKLFLLTWVLSRYVALSLNAKLSRHDSSSTSAKVWKEAGLRWAEWRNGYSGKNN